MAIFPGSAIPSAVSDYEIENSCRFNNASAPYLLRDPSGAGNRRTFTLSMWFKRGILGGASNRLFSAYESSDERVEVYFDLNKDTLWCEIVVGGTGRSLETSQVFRDPAAWYHLVWAVDTTQGTDTNRTKIYINGSQVTAFDTSTYPVENADTAVNYTVDQVIGKTLAGGDNYWDGYLAEVYMIDGTQHAASDFGELDSTTNQWIPLDSDDVKDDVPFGTNGFYQKYNSTELAASFDDSSSSDHTITANGDATNQRPQHHDVTANGYAHLIGPPQGSSLITFDGTGDYLSVAGDADFNWGTQDITAEMWFYIDDDTNRKYLCGPGTDSDTHYDGWALDYSSTGHKKLSLWASSNGTSWDMIHSDAGGAGICDTVITLNTWHHVAVVRNGTNWQVYLDGVSDLSITAAGSVYSGASTTWGIGRIGNDVFHFDGYMGSMRFSTGIARYTTSFIPPTTAFTDDSDTILLIQDGTDGTQTFTDDNSSGRSAHTITDNGDVRWFAPKVGAGAMAFDGTGDYLTLSSSSGNELIAGSGSWTIEGWLKWDGSQAGIFMEQGDAASRALQIWIQADGDIQVYLSDTDGSYPFNEVSGTTLTAHTWTHIALVKNGSAITLYKDGARDSVIDGSTTQSTINTSSYPLYIGTYNAGAGSDWSGYMDQVRISRVVRYTGASFTVPTTAFTDDINTGLLLNADLNQGTWFEDQSTGLAISTDSRMDFGGTSSDYLSIPDSSDWDIENKTDYTIEAWVKHNDHSGSEVYVGHREDGDNLWFFGSTDGTGVRYRSVSGGSSLIDISGGEITDTSWHHVAVVKDGSDYEIFKDGVSVATGTNSTTDTFSASLTIGDYSSIPFDGYMDEIRLSDSARYTAAFTPQTRGNPFTSDGIPYS